MKHTLTLDYTLCDSWLSPWLDGLRSGEAVAATCSACGDVNFPPLRTCPACQTPCDGWQRLSGAATILFRTTGADGDVAMVRFDGASRGAIVRTDALPPDATRGVLAACPDAAPRLALITEPQT